MSDFDFVTYKERDYRYYHGTRKENVHHGRNRHPLDASTRDKMTKLGNELGFWEREERRRRRNGGAFWEAIENRLRIEAELKQIGQRP